MKAIEIMAIEEHTLLLEKAVRQAGGELKGDGYIRLGNMTAETIARILRHLLQAQRWRPINEAPKDGSWILLRGRNGIGKHMTPVVVAWRYGEGPSGYGKAWRDSASLRDMGFLAADEGADWMPLPEPPSDQQSRE